MARSQFEDEDKSRKRGDKKSGKDKRRQDHHQQQPERQSGQNGALVQNGKASKKEAGAKASPSKKETKIIKHTSSKWSGLGMVNVILFLGVVAAAATCAFLYTEGDLSVEGVHAAWPRVRRNSVVLFNLTKETADCIWKTMGPIVLKVQDTLILSFNATKNVAVNAYQACGLGDPAPYLEGVRLVWEFVVSSVLWLLWATWELVVTVDWALILSRMLSVVQFLGDQVRLVNKEFWSNESVSTAWEHLKPVREVVWEWTDALVHLLIRLYSEFIAHWWPLIKEQSYTLYLSGKHSILSLFE